MQWWGRGAPRKGNNSNLLNNLVDITVYLTLKLPPMRFEQKGVFLYEKLQALNKNEFKV